MAQTNNFDIITVKTSKYVKRLFPNFIWNIATNQKDLYLTFDDGPIEDVTPWVLDTLKEFNAKASFFCVGKNIAANPQIVQNMLQEGHMVCNHTFNHKNGWQTPLSTYIAEVEETQLLIEKMIPLQPKKLFRPPYGKITPWQSRKLRELEFSIVMWDVLSYDWQSSLKEEECLKNVTTNAVPGSIIVLHDSHKAAKNLYYTLPRILEYYSNKGYRFLSML